MVVVLGTRSRCVDQDDGATDVFFSSFLVFIVAHKELSWSKQQYQQLSRCLNRMPKTTTMNSINNLSTSQELPFDKNRMVTVREAAALQSFPKDYEFLGTTGENYRQVGNAVPDEVAAAVARSIRSLMEDLE